MEGMAYGIYWVCYNQWFRQTPAPVVGVSPKSSGVSPTLTFFGVKSWQKHCTTTYTLPILTLRPPPPIWKSRQNNWCKVFRTSMFNKPSEFANEPRANKACGLHFWYYPRLVSKLWSFTGKHEYHQVWSPFWKWFN